MDADSGGITVEALARHPALRPLAACGYPPARIAAVLRRYQEPQRRYHDLNHVAEMLEAVCAFGLTLRPAQALAVVFHDAVYVPGAARGANEALSAQLLRVCAEGVDAALIEQACRIVLDSTRHVASCDDASLVLDLDLLRLGAPAADFDRHSLALYAEQRLLLPADDALAWRSFRQRRVAFFEMLLARSAIYLLPALRARYEQAARANLRRAIAAACGG